MVDGLLDKVFIILWTAASEMDSRRPPCMCRVDPVMAIDKQNWIQKDCEAEIALFDVLEAVPMTKFAKNEVPEKQALQL